MLDERDLQKVRRVAKTHRSRANIVNAESIPVRDTDDAYGNPFLGLPGNRLRANAVSNAELAPDAVLNGNIGEQINATHLPDIGGLNGPLPRSKLPAIDFGDLQGKLGAHRISGKIPKHNISGVNWDQVDNKPPLATKHYVDTSIDDLKTWANKRFQRK